MSKSIKIDDATYEIVAKFAQQEDRSLSNALARLVKLGLDSVVLQDSVTPVAEIKPVVTTTSNFSNGIDWAKIEKETLSPEGRKKFQKQLKEAQKRETERGSVMGELTDQDLSTARVSFQEKPDFEEPEKWNSHAWPTV